MIFGPEVIHGTRDQITDSSDQEDQNRGNLVNEGSQQCRTNGLSGGHADHADGGVHSDPTVLYHLGGVDGRADGENIKGDIRKEVKHGKDDNIFTDHHGRRQEQHKNTSEKVQLHIVEFSSDDGAKEVSENTGRGANDSQGA